MHTKRFQLGLILSPESGDGSSGGSGSIGAIATQLFNNGNHTEGNGNTGPDSGADSGDSAGGESTGDHDSSLSGNSKSKQGKGEKANSPILEQLKRQQAGESGGNGTSGESADNSAEEGSEEKGNGDGNGNRQEGKKKQEELTDEELLNIEDKDITTKDGKPPSAQVTVLVNNLKKHLKDRNDEVVRLKSELSKNSNEALGGRIKELETQLTEKDKSISTLQSQIDDEFFEKSAGFLETFKKPVDSSLELMVEYFEEYNTPEHTREQKEIGDLFAQATSFANQGKRAQFLSVIDKIAESYIDGGASIKASFVSDSKDFFVAQREYNKALSEKGENRKKLVQNKLEETRAKNRVGAERGIDSHVNKFEATNSKFMESLDETTRGKFQSLYRENAKSAKSMLAEFAATGIMPDALNDIIAKGVTYDAASANASVAWSAFNDGVNKVRILEKENNELKARLARYTKEPDQSQQRSSGNGGNPVNGNRTGKSAIMEQLRNHPEFA